MNAKFIKQIKDLDFAIKIFQRQIREIAKPLKLKFDSLPVKEQEKSLKSEAIYLYLKNFSSRYEFLTKKIGTEKSINLHFYLPSLRILLEIYGELLYFLNQNNKNQIGIFTGNYLLWLSDYNRFIAIGNTAIENEYRKYLNTTSNVLSKERIQFTNQIKSFDKSYLGRMGFKFPQFEQIFQKRYFFALSKKTFKCWQKDKPSTFYNKYYRLFSNYAHGSFKNQTDSATGNEIFWMVQFMYLIAQLMFELSDKKIFNSKSQHAYEIFTKRIAKSYPAFLKNWDKYRAKLSKIKTVKK